MMRRGVGRRGRPGLVGTVARTAVVAGTATAVAGGVSRHSANKQQAKAEAAANEQQQADAQQQAAAAPPPPPAPAAPPPPPAPAAAAPDPIAQLKELAALKDQGILTDEEFAAEKAKILGS